MRAAVAAPARRRWRWEVPEAARPWVVCLWALAAHGVVLWTSPLRTTPVDAFFFGDSFTFFEQARRLAVGEPALEHGLPYHPPLATWLLVPLWWALDAAAAVAVAAKATMVVASAATYALAYRLLRQRLPGAFWICLLLPLDFGELALNAAVSNEVVYRLLLALLLVLGWRWPPLAGALHGLAALARVEHLPFALLLAVAIAVRQAARRRAILTAAAAAAAVLLPVVGVNARTLAEFNRRHAAELPEPLPVWVPVSFYGPLNFALAQREPEIFFSRRTLPPPPGRPASLEPTYPPHNSAIVHGYRLGVEEIARRPARFLGRAVAKVGHSLQALAYGWTWRDLPKPGRWVRQPVDLAHASSPAWTAVALALTALGAWRLRRERGLLAVGGLLLVYRLAVNALFFPYLRGMMVVAPFFLALFWTGWGALLRKHLPRALAIVWVVLAGLHLGRLIAAPDYRLSGERTADGQIIDDRRVVIVRRR